MTSRRASGAASAMRCVDQLCEIPWKPYTRIRRRQRSGSAYVLAAAGCSCGTQYRRPRTARGAAAGLGTAVDHFERRRLVQRRELGQRVQLVEEPSSIRARRLVVAPVHDPVDHGVEVFGALERLVERRQWDRRTRGPRQRELQRGRAGIDDERGGPPHPFHVHSTTSAMSSPCSRVHSRPASGHRPDAGAAPPPESRDRGRDRSRRSRGGSGRGR